MLLIAAFFAIALLTMSGVIPLDDWLGWTGANIVIMATSALVLLALAWNVLGFFMDGKDTKPSGEDGNLP